MTQHTLPHITLFHSLSRMAQLRREALDLNMLQAILMQMPPVSAQTCLQSVVAQLPLRAPKQLGKLDPAYCPLLVCEGDTWSVVAALRPEGNWACLTFDADQQKLVETLREGVAPDALIFRMDLQQRFVASKSPSMKMIMSELLVEKRVLFEIVAGSLFVSIVALVASIYSMQVYDRVIPTNATATLMVLTLGALVAAVLDSVAKWIRSHSVSELSDRVDQRLARSVFSRFLGVRLDVMPPSVGTMAQRMRSYESVRQFLVSSITSFAVDIPLALIFLAVFAAIAGPLALIPAVFLTVGIIGALIVSRRIQILARNALPAHNLKMGHLVESVEGAEIIKSGHGGWRMLAKWLDMTDSARAHDHDMKNVTEGFQFFTGLAQQISYTALVALGALSVASGSITMGGLIASSILSGRILSPLAALVGVIVQWANTKASLQDLDKFWQLDQDISQDTAPLVVSAINGNYQLENVRVNYLDLPALTIENLRIVAGQSIAILGPIGSGKTTLLRILSGLYKPQQGRVTVDGLNIFDIDKATLAANVAFVPQDGRLFAGSLRENLTIGMEDPGDQDLITESQVSGLFDSVIAPHPKGLGRDIAEGGHGLSGGQRQLVHITRAMLRRPNVWLLDEPTAAMDAQSEEKVIQAFQNIRKNQPNSVFVFVTHKPQVAQLADRVIILQAGQLVLDGPKAEVFSRLQGNSVAPNQRGAS